MKYLLMLLCVSATVSLVVDTDLGGKNHIHLRLVCYKRDEEKQEMGPLFKVICSYSKSLNS